MKVYYERDCNIDRLLSKKIAIIGYGNQAHAHAANLRDSGVRDMVIGLYDGSKSKAKAEADGFKVLPTAQAARGADMVMLLAPDENQGQIYRDDLAGEMKSGAALLFGHGFNIHFKEIVPRADLDVMMVAPKGPGRALRSSYQAGGGLACLIAIAQDHSREAFANALAYAGALGGGRAGIFETSFQEECEADLFGEQAVLCGGIIGLIHAGFETLVEAGFAPEIAYFECVHEVKLIADLVQEHGIADMRLAISNTAEYGGYRAGAALVTDATRKSMREILNKIQNGDFARDFLQDHKAGWPALYRERRREQSHAVESAGKMLRQNMKLKS